MAALSSVLGAIPAETRRHGPGSVCLPLHADRVYGTKYNYQMIFSMIMIPSIRKQRGTDKVTANRPKTAGMLDPYMCRLKILTNVVYGAEDAPALRYRTGGQPSLVCQFHRLELAGARPV